MVLVMTDLLSRPRSTPAKDPGRPLPAGGALAAVVGIGASLLPCAVVALLGWFLADAGAHGSTTDALRVGADAWLSAVGGRVVVNGIPIGMLPLALTAMVAICCHRAGRWAAQSCERVEEDRPVALAALVAGAVGVVIGVLIALVASHPQAEPSLPRTVLGSFLLTGVACGLGIAAETGRLAHWTALVPGWVRAVAEGAVGTVLAMVAIAAALATGALLVHLNDAESLMSGLRLGSADALMVTVVTACYAPNLVLLALSWLVGPGFAVGVGTTVSPTGVDLGPLPGFPVLAALPQSTPPGWVAVVMAVPVVVAALAAARAQARYAVVAWDSSALRGFGSGFAAAVLTTVVVGLAGGPWGTGRLAEVGAPVGELLVVAVGGMSIGGLLGGLAVCAVQKWRAQQS